MRPSRVLVLLTALVVVATPVESVAATGRAPQDTTIRGEQQYRTGVYTDRIGSPVPNDRVGFAGRLLDAQGNPIPNETLALLRRLRGQRSWTRIAETKTGDAGSPQPGWAIFHTNVVGNAGYRVVYAGDAHHAPSRSAPMMLRAMRDLNAQLVQHGKGTHKKAFLRGNVNPGWAGKQITWQRKKCRTCHWRTIAHRQTSPKIARWRFRGAYPPLHHTWFFRAKVRRTDRFVASYSRILRTRSVKAG